MGGTSEWERIANTPADDDTIASYIREAKNCHCLGCMEKLQLIARMKVEQATIARLTAFARRSPPMPSDHEGAAVFCAECGQRKKPAGRSAPMEMAGSLCDDDCPGYRKEPRVGHLWPGETCDDFGYCHMED
jgi:hypothetical protein